MIPLLYIFSICFLSQVSPIEVTDCSFTGEVIENRHEFESKYQYLGGKEIPSTVAGFTIHSERKIFIYNEKVIETVIHEIKHAKCIVLLKGLPTQLELCHYRVDLEYNVQSRPNGYDEWQGITDNTPPEINPKITYQQLIFSNQYR